MSKYECKRTLRVKKTFLGYYTAFIDGKTYDLITEDRNSITLLNERGNDHILDHSYWPLYFNEIDNLDFNIL